MTTAKDSGPPSRDPRVFVPDLNLKAPAPLFTSKTSLFVVDVDNMDSGCGEKKSPLQSAAHSLRFEPHGDALHGGRGGMGGFSCRH